MAMSSSYNASTEYLMFTKGGVRQSIPRRPPSNKKQGYRKFRIRRQTHHQAKLKALMTCNSITSLRHYNKCLFTLADGRVYNDYPMQNLKTRSH